jgi:hypothetical protein
MTGNSSFTQQSAGRPPGLRVTEQERSDAYASMARFYDKTIPLEVRKAELRAESERQKFVRNYLRAGESWSCSFCRAINHVGSNRWRQHMRTATHTVIEIAHIVGM